MTDELQIFAILPGYCLILIMLVAAVTDVVSHRIPNLLIVPALGIALLIGAASGIYGVLMSVAGLAIGLAMLLPLYAMGAMGAGDVKLLGVAGAFLGPHGALIAGVMTFIAGAILGLLWIGWRLVRPGVLLFVSQFLETRMRLGKLAATTLLAERQSSFAYAPAIATGVVIAIWQLGWSVPLIQG